MIDPSRTVNPDMDVLVIGAGHAGCEAALAAARMGCRTLLVTPNLDRIGFMPCNPSIGGPGKSQLVAEVDALGGAMAEVTDAAALQVRLLNTSKGPAVQALRAQVDKVIYAMLMKGRLEQQPNLTLLQDEATGLLVSDRSSPSVVGVTLRVTGSVSCRAVVVTAGTFLRAVMIAGESRQQGGRSGDGADDQLTRTLADLGISTRRFKTGTPPRIDARTVDLDLSEMQLGDDRAQWLSRLGALGGVEPMGFAPAPSVSRGAAVRGGRNQLACHRVSTNPATHDVVARNIHRAPMFNGAISGVGPRYCPSIEDKVVRFAEKASHPVFLEPEGWRSGEFYVQGMSTSLPADVQHAALRTIPALAEVEVTRFGYAVEYDAVAPSALRGSLEARAVSGLFLAGQINGTSGYEEAAAQGIVAGINAGALVTGQPALELRRDQAYIGVMIDDLTTKVADEPYRMLTARAEFRLILRSSTAAERLGEIALRYGVISPDRRRGDQADEAELTAAVERFGAIRLTPGSVVDQLLAVSGEPGLSKPMTARDLGRRPTMTLARLRALLQAADIDMLTDVNPRLSSRLAERLQFDGFVEREAREAVRLSSIGMRPLMISNFDDVPSLRTEARQQLAAADVVTFADARRLPGVTPADVAALLVHIERTRARR